jgi:hypothetical protein
LLLVLEAWVAWDLVGIPDRRWSAGLILLFASNLVSFGFARMVQRRWPRWFGLTALGSTYIVTHAFVLGIQLVLALAFVSLLIIHLELRILAERFAPLFTETISPAQRKQIAGALLRASIRLTIASMLSVALPLLAADLATAGIFPLTTIPTALLLSAGLVAVVLLIALLPTLEPRADGKG